MRTNEFSSELYNYIRQFSACAAADMCEGGNDPECVAEQVFIALSCQAPELKSEYNGLIKEHGYRAVLKAASKVVYTI